LARLLRALLRLPERCGQGADLVVQVDDLRVGERVPVLHEDGLMDPQRVFEAAGVHERRAEPFERRQVARVGLVAGEVGRERLLRVAVSLGDVGPAIVVPAELGAIGVPVRKLHETVQMGDGRVVLLVGEQELGELDQRWPVRRCGLEPALQVPDGAVDVVEGLERHHRRLVVALGSGVAGLGVRLPLQEFQRPGAIALRVGEGPQRLQGRHVSRVEIERAFVGRAGRRGILQTVAGDLRDPAVRGHRLRPDDVLGQAPPVLGRLGPRAPPLGELGQAAAGRDRRRLVLQRFAIRGRRGVRVPERSRVVRGQLEPHALPLVVVLGLGPDLLEELRPTRRPRVPRQQPDERSRRGEVPGRRVEHGLVGRDGGVGVLAPIRVDGGDAGEDLGDLFGLGREGAAPLQHVEQLVPALPAHEEALEPVERLGVRRLQLEDGVQALDGVLGLPQSRARECGRSAASRRPATPRPLRLCRCSSSSSSASVRPSSR
jgi:hypothetical protein